jgi:hypothetical protein
MAMVAWAASGAAQPERAVRLEVDVSAIAQADAPHIERATLEQIDPLLRDRSYIRADDADDAIEIRVDYVDREDREYSIHIDIYDQGQLVEPGIPWFVCKFCPQGMVAEAVAEQLPAAIDLLEQAQAHSDEANTSPTRPEPETPAAEHKPPPLVHPPLVHPIGWLGLGGAVVAVGGLATGIAGVVRLKQGRVAEPSRAEQQRIEDYRPAGRVLLGVGVGVLVLGTAAVVTDVVLRSKKRKAVALAPSWSVGAAALTVSIRF